MTRDPALYLEDMLSYALDAHRFVEGMTLETFARDARTQYAVKYALHIVGEAAGKVPVRIRERFRRSRGCKSSACATGWRMTILEPASISFLQRRVTSHLN